MLKCIAPALGAAILAFGALYGCGELPSAPQTTEAAVEQIDKVTTLETSSPTTNTSSKSNSVFAPKPYERYLKELKLTDEQAAKARRCLEQYRNCVKESHTAYINAHREINKRYENAAREIRHLVELGQLTAEQARERLQAAKEKANAALREAIQAAHKNVAKCEQNFGRCIREFLTREQIEKWERLIQPK